MPVFGLTKCGTDRAPSGMHSLTSPVKHIGTKNIFGCHEHLISVCFSGWLANESTRTNKNSFAA
jgi:hypothetical protein